MQYRKGARQRCNHSRKKNCTVEWPPQGPPERRRGSALRAVETEVPHLAPTTPSCPPTMLYLNPPHLRQLPPSVPGWKIHATRLFARPTFCQADFLPCRILATITALHPTAVAAEPTTPAATLLALEPSKGSHSQGPRTLAMPPFCQAAFLPRRRFVAPNRSSRTRTPRVAPTVPSTLARLMPRPVTS